jgi:hypothetical protein
LKRPVPYPPLQLNYPELTVTLWDDLENGLNGPRLVAGDDLFEAHVGANIRRGCANNRYPLVLRWTDQQNETAPDAAN